MQAADQADFKPFDASQWRLGIVVAQFNKEVTDRLHKSALDRAAEYKIPQANIKTITVAGAVEIPLALQNLAKTGKYDALLAIGCVIQGDTPHFDYVCKIVSEGVLRVQLDHDQPIGFGILTCLNQDQAIDRSDLGGDHLDAVLHLTQTLRQAVT